MDNTYITGDRSFGILYPTLVAIEMMRALASGKTIVTGNSETGVEAHVRDFAERAGVNIVVYDYAEDWTWRQRFDAAQSTEGGVEFVAIHTDPHASSVIKGLFAATKDDEVRLVGQADLV